MMLEHRISIHPNRPNECRWCHREILRRRGRHGRLFYYHKSHLKRRVGESRQHQLGKQAVAEYFKAREYHVELEQYLPQVKQRADIVLVPKQGSMIVIEYQCAKITPLNVQRRTHRYQHVGFQIHWLLGPTYQQHIPYAFLKLTPAGLQANFFDNHHWQKIIYDGANPLVQREQITRPARLRQQIMRGLYFCKTPYRQIQNELYQIGYNLSDIPVCCLPTETFPPGPKAPYWYILLRLWLALSTGPKSVEALVNVMTPIAWHQSAFITETVWRKYCLADILRVWTAQGVICRNHDLICLNEKSIIK